MIFKVAICDDDKKDIQIIHDFLISFEMDYDIDFEITSFANSGIFLSGYNAPGTFNIIFLDVEMPVINSIETAKRIRSLPDRMAKIIFVSNYPEYMQRSFDVSAYNYLLKPLQYEDFKQLMYRIIEDYKNSSVTKLLLKEDGGEELIYIDDIISINVLDAKKGILQFTLSDKKIETKGMISEWENELGSHYFVSPCRGYLININQIHFFKDTSLIMSNSQEIPLSRRKRKEINNMFTKHLITINHMQ